MYFVQKVGVNMDDVLERILDCIGPKHGSIKELADYLEVTPNVITNWKNGNSHSYRKYLKEIAAYFNVSARSHLYGFSFFWQM